MSNRTPVLVLSGLVLLSTTAAGCTGDPAASRQHSDQRTQADRVTVSRPWVKATDHGATAAFGTLRNTTGTSVRITAATSPAAPAVQLHETAQSADGGTSMREKKGGFVVAAHGRHALAPGGDHLMLTKVDTAIEPGDDVRITLVFRDGSRRTFTAPARSYSGAKESYQPDTDDE